MSKEYTPRIHNQRARLVSHTRLSVFVDDYDHSRKSRAQVVRYQSPVQQNMSEAWCDAQF